MCYENDKFDYVRKTGKLNLTPQTGVELVPEMQTRGTISFRKIIPTTAKELTFIRLACIASAKY